jgi:hypothetical protein
MKQKLILEGLKAKQEMLRLQIQMAREQMGGLASGCNSLEHENGAIQRRIETLRVSGPCRWAPAHGPLQPPASVQPSLRPPQPHPSRPAFVNSARASAQPVHTPRPDASLPLPAPQGKRSKRPDAATTAAVAALTVAAMQTGALPPAAAPAPAGPFAPAPPAPVPQQGVQPSYVAAEPQQQQHYHQHHHQHHQHQPLMLMPEADGAAGDGELIWRSPSASAALAWGGEWDGSCQMLD